MTEKKKILILAGSRWQIPIVKKIKDMGHKALVLNPYENSPAFKYADGYEMIDILDREACLKYAKKNKVDAVLSEECDIAMPTVAYIAESMGLPSIGSDMAALYTNKLLMRDFCKRNGFRYPEYEKCFCIDDAKRFLKNISRKIIIKPLDSNSSRGVYTIENEQQLERFFDESISYSKTEKCVIAERYIEGTEFTVDGISTQDNHYSLAISEKKHYEYNKNVANELFFSHDNPNYDYEKLREVNNAFVKCSGLGCALTHAEYKYEAGEFYLIEIAARGGGNLISSDIVPIMSGVDNYKYLINASIGEENREKFEINPAFIERAAVLKFLDIPKTSGTVEKICGMNFVTGCDNIVKWDVYYKEGEKIVRAENDSQRVGFYIAFDNSVNSLKKLMKETEEKFRIELKRS